MDDYLITASNEPVRPGKLIVYGCEVDWEGADSPEELARRKSSKRVPPSWLAYGVPDLEE